MKRYRARDITRRHGFLKTDKGKLQWIRPKAEGPAGSRPSASRIDGEWERLLAVEKGSGDSMEVMSVMLPGIVEDLSNESKIELYSHITSLLLKAVENGADISPAIPALAGLIERAVEEPELYGQCGTEAALMNAVKILRIAAENGMGGVDNLRVRGALKGVLEHSNREVRRDAGAALFCIPQADAGPVLFCIPQASEVSGGPDTDRILLFDEKVTGKKGRVSWLTESCSLLCESVDDLAIRLRMVHYDSETYETISLAFRESKADGWRLDRRHVTDEGTEVWLIGQGGRIEARLGPKVGIPLPVFGIEDTPSCEIDSILRPYGEGGEFPIGLGYFLGIGHDRPGPLEGRGHGARVEFRLYFHELFDPKSGLPKPKSDNVPYNRQFLLSGIGSRRSFAIENLRVDVVLEPDGIRITKSGMGDVQ